MADSLQYDQDAQRVGIPPDFAPKQYVNGREARDPLTFELEIGCTPIGIKLNRTAALADWRQLLAG